ncbi:MAG: hypothetical protein L0Y61_09470 [Epsilonproteobacteria bacterium]|nr:hypothetical protein [Campylobacterota bacterium]
MGKYGQVASIATNMLVSNQVNDPIQAWELAAIQVFPASKSSQNKSCPKSSFLGLCEDGYIPNVEKGKYTRSKKNKVYAVKGLSLLTSNPDLSEMELWKMAIDKSDKTYNHQMDIVKTLWDNNLINQKNISTLE